MTGCRSLYGVMLVGGPEAAMMSHIVAGQKEQQERMWGGCIGGEQGGVT